MGKMLELDDDETQDMMRRLRSSIQVSAGTDREQALEGLKRLLHERKQSMKTQQEEAARGTEQRRQRQEEMARQAEQEEKARESEQQRRRQEETVRERTTEARRGGERDGTTGCSTRKGNLVSADAKEELASQSARKIATSVSG